jgi:predicted PurR-regulated permease PerM
MEQRGMEAVGSETFWVAVGAIVAAILAILGFVGTWFRVEYRTEDNAKQLDALMNRVQHLFDTKAGRDEMKQAIADLSRSIDASDARVEKTVTSLASSLTSQITTLATSMTGQITHLTTRIDAMMQRTRSTSS